MHRKTWMKINLDAIEENVRMAKKYCQKKLIAVLKANAYGCGARQVSKAVLEAGADMIAVSSVDEAIMVRNDGYEGPLLILGMTDVEDIDVLVQNRISTAGFSPEWVKSVTEHGCKGLSVHLKVDTGMNRIGFKSIPQLVQAYADLTAAGASIDGIFTHFCCADTDQAFTQKQFDFFAQAVNVLPEKPAWIHCDNSDATMYFKDHLSNACRFGISLYGINTYCDQLEPVISLYSTIMMEKTVPAGQTVGYGATYTTSKEEIIATMPIGYADGFIRKNQGRKVYVDGMYVPIVGRVCMDQAMLSLPHEVPLNSTVEIFGDHISLSQMADELDTIPYEIICLISSRVTRKYIWHGKEFAENNILLHESEK